MLVVHTGTRLADGVAVPERVPVLVRVLLRVARGEREGVLVLADVFVIAEVAVNDRDTEDDGDTVPLEEAELDALDEPLEDPEAEAEADDVGVRVMEEPTVDAGLPDKAELTVEVDDPVDVLVPVAETVGLGSKDAVAVDVKVEVGDTHSSPTLNETPHI